ncbi:MAG: tyrosine-type recombinase/integrase [Gammaproteobacteria bacterium]|nr:tyrosine-type recombinase/integrase [Gammaproteobacteria bacterium]
MAINYLKDELDNGLVVESIVPPSNNTIPLSNRYQIAATSDNTRRAYQADIRHFESWGGQLPTTTDAVLRYLHAFAETLNPRTLSRRITAIKQWHRYQRLADPTEAPIVSKTLIGITRIHGKPKDKAPPLLPEHLIQITDYLAAQSTLADFRDSALLQVGFLGAFRRSELVAIRMEDINWQPAGIEILIPKSKTDPSNQGQYCVIPNGNNELCAVRALKTWLEKAGIDEGFAFRRIHRGNKLSDLNITADSVNEILKNRAYEASIENAMDFSSHSMRRGLATTASRDGVSLPAIMRQGRWKQVGTVMEYIEAAQRFEENAAGQILQKLPYKDKSKPEE